MFGTETPRGATPARCFSTCRPQRERLPSSSIAPVRPIRLRRLQDWGCLAVRARRGTAERQGRSPFPRLSAGASDDARPPKLNCPGRFRPRALKLGCAAGNDARCVNITMRAHLCLTRLVTQPLDFSADVSVFHWHTSREAYRKSLVSLCALPSVRDLRVARSHSSTVGKLAWFPLLDPGEFAATLFSLRAVLSDSLRSMLSHTGLSPVAAGDRLFRDGDNE